MTFILHWIETSSILYRVHDHADINAFPWSIFFEYIALYSTHSIMMYSMFLLVCFVMVRRTYHNLYFNYAIIMTWLTWSKVLAADDTALCWSWPHPLAMDKFIPCLLLSLLSWEIVKQNSLAWLSTAAINNTLLWHFVSSEVRTTDYGLAKQGGSPLQCNDF